VVPSPVQQVALLLEALPSLPLKLQDLSLVRLPVEQRAELSVLRLQEGTLVWAH
jgi:hypothetical protein